ncbi:MAG: thiopurine S-methyltransferase [Pseudomonadota bacterium]
MQREYWQDKWRENKIGFHEPAPHVFLRNHLKSLDLRAGETVFVPLCGKTLDLDWLLGNGLRVIGVEFNQTAIEEVFERLDLVPALTENGPLLRFEAGGLTLYLGDFFDLDRATLGKVHAVYDRAALVALPKETRARYAAHLAEITGSAPQLAIVYSYDQSQTQGPPFSVPTPVVEGLYRETYRCIPVDSKIIEGPLAARCSGEENAMLLVPT